ncbi:deoxyribonuclease-1-like 2 [Haliotis rufescens]|uniref:deoxyribonuclease-1-like 2 n=1 Tax=Haliotis rufescens TaxID=6454 RepID=UPI00201F45A0|nr:deoxyribonuclease-1-like 2 [Haliotis rufescens]
MGLLVVSLLALGVGLVTPWVGTIRIGAFNIKSFGRRKMGDPIVAQIITQIVSRYDVILIQEIRDITNTAVNELHSNLSAHVKAANPSACFSFKISPRLGRSRYKEQYAFFYRSDRVDVVASHLFTESRGDVFEREPFCLLLNIPGLAGPWRLALVGLHTKPTQAVAEIQYLFDQVEAEVKVTWNTQNLLYLGDLNADCRYVPVSHQLVTGVFHQPGYRSLIGSDADTTTGRSHCSYDRIVATGSDVISAVQSSRVYLFDLDLGLDSTLTNRVSDHYPVEVELRAP